MNRFFCDKALPFPSPGSIGSLQRVKLTSMIRD
jgi:hypothetical protein